WEQLQGREFDLDAAAQVLVDEYGIEMDVARQDAQRWIDKLVECEIIA
ncbi:MAG: PqqD family protein, partial [Alistipes sp.]|nr:PqqD family protein [Alistipes sp.]